MHFLSTPYSAGCLQEEPAITASFIIPPVIVRPTLFMCRILLLSFKMLLSADNKRKGGGTPACGQHVERCHKPL